MSSTAAPAAAVPAAEAKAEAGAPIASSRAKVGPVLEISNAPPPYPDVKEIPGRFGKFGGRYIPETLAQAHEELEEVRFVGCMWLCACMRASVGACVCRRQCGTATARNAESRKKSVVADDAPSAQFFFLVTLFCSRRFPSQCTTVPAFRLYLTVSSCGDPSLRPHRLTPCFHTPLIP